jgi:hypothetical protein
VFGQTIGCGEKLKKEGQTCEEKPTEKKQQPLITQQVAASCLKNNGTDFDDFNKWRQLPVHK